MTNKERLILDRIPVINVLVRLVVDNPTFTSSTFMETNAGAVLADWRKKHPNTHITRKLGKRILENFAKKHPNVDLGAVSSASRARKS